MKYAADFRADARSALTGKWKTAVVAGLVASLLGGVAEGVSFNTGNANFEANLGDMKESFASMTPQWSSHILGIVSGVSFPSRI